MSSPPSSPYDKYNLVQLTAELQAGGVHVDSLTLYIDAEGTEYFHNITPELVEEDLPPEADPIIAAHDPTVQTRTDLFEQQEDAARLQLIRDRADMDPAFAALADLTLPKG